ncbi:hypothetical protein VKT23_010422 [Stygiomarasmius scandens]|uniref:Uncharacterized protein n=1 Tax=Marasmiellus scandens TaxID=2682957 RepID=A0ABR1JC85_9AGAR
MTGEWTFVVFVDAQRGTIVHTTSSDARVYDIIERVKREQETRRNFRLFKPDGLPLEPYDSLLERIKKWIEQNPSAPALGDSRLLSRYFPHGPSSDPTRDEVHLVAIPSSESMFISCNFLEFCSLQIIADAVSERPRNLIPLDKRIVKRTRNVTALLDKLLDMKLVQIKGGSSSGKSTMLDLLADAILTRYPDACLFRITNWDRKGKDCEERFFNSVRNIDTGLPISLFNLQQLSEYNRPPLFLLHDMAQESFAEIDLWLLYRTSTCSNLHIAFTSVYDFPSEAWEELSHGIQGPAITLSQRVSYLPMSEEEIVQLSFTLAEFQEYRAARLQEDPKFEIDDDLAALMYRWTSGHPGALEAFFEVVKSLVSQLPSLTERYLQQDNKAPQGKIFSLHDFDKILATMLLGDHCKNAISTLFRDTGVFRGLIPDGVAPEPETVDFIRLLLQKTELFINLLTDPKPPGLEDAAKRGWVVTYSQRFYIWVFFASPLHRCWFAERFGKFESGAFADTLLDSTRDAVSRFRPTQLRKIQMQMGTVSASVPETRYKNEFYRACSNSTTGASSVLFTPESGTDFSSRPVGRIDCYVAPKRWGIELTYDGSKLDEYSARFSSIKAYDVFLSNGLMIDYILLDFCDQLPVEKHNVQGLYHLVFSDDYSVVRIYNCNLEQVGGPLALVG